MENETGVSCVSDSGSHAGNSLQSEFVPPSQPLYLTNEARTQAENSLLLPESLMNQIDSLVCNQDLQQMLGVSSRASWQSEVWGKKLILELLVGNWPAECAGAMCLLLALVSCILALLLACRRADPPSLESPTSHQVHCSSFKRAISSLSLFLLICIVFCISVSIVAMSNMTRGVTWQQGHGVTWAVIDSQQALQTSTDNILALVHQHRITVSEKILDHVREQLEGGYDSLLAKLSEKSAVSNTISSLQYMDQSMKELNYLTMDLSEQISKDFQTNQSVGGGNWSGEQHHTSSCPEIDSAWEDVFSCWEKVKTGGYKDRSRQILSLLDTIRKASERFYTEKSTEVYESIQNSFMKSTEHYIKILKNLSKELKRVLSEQDDELQSSIDELKISVDKIGQDLSKTAAEINRTPVALWSRRLATLLWTWTLTVPLLSILAVLKLLAALVAAYFPSTSSLKPHFHTINTLRCGVCVLGTVSVAVWISTAALVIIASLSSSLLCPRDCTNSTAPANMAATSRFFIGSDFYPFGNTSGSMQPGMAEVLRSCQSGNRVFEAFKTASDAKVWQLSELSMQNAIGVLSLLDVEYEKQFKTAAAQIHSHLKFVDKISSIDFSVIGSEERISLLLSRLAGLQADLIAKSDHIRSQTLITDDFMSQNASALINQEMIMLKSELYEMARHYLRNSFNLAGERRGCESILNAFKFVELCACRYFPGSLHVLWMSLAVLGCLLIPTMLITSCQLHLLHQHQHFLLINASNSPRPCLWQNLSDETLRCSRRGSETEEVIEFSP